MSRNKIETNLYIAEAEDVCITEYTRRIEPLCVDVFQIGDRVESTIGSCTGTVVGYELETNKVVIRTDNSKGRVRYAYGVNEIDHIEDVMEFKLNRKYRKGNNIYRVIENLGPAEFYLIDDKTGTIHCALDSTMEKQMLRKLDLDGLEMI